MLRVILNQLGHNFDSEASKVLRPTKTVVTKRTGKSRVTQDMKTREFYREVNGVMEAYTPKSVNTAHKDLFQLGLYKSPTGIFLPREKNAK